MSDQLQNNRERFAGPHMIQDMDHMSHILPVDHESPQPTQQATQGRGDSRQVGTKRVNKFEYQNPRQVY